jgi:uncharacterized membrane protein YfcA
VSRGGSTTHIFSTKFVRFVSAATKQEPRASIDFREMKMMALSVLQTGLGLFSGSLVGFSLGLVGGGGSILAVPLMVYLVGVADPHVALGTSAIAVAANAAVNLANHARAGNVKWRCATVFATTGIAGAYGGSSLGKMVGGQKLLMLFALVMLVIGALMLHKR